MFRSVSCRVLALLCACFLSTPAAIAQAPHDSPVSKGDGVLVLAGGRIVEGRISQSASGYVVEMATGRLVVPFDRVQVEAESRHVAYQKMRAKLSNRAAERVRLAQWCLTNSMADECRTELKAALELDPTNAQAREMLTRLEELTNPENPLHRGGQTSIVRGADGFEIREARSLGGLSRESAVEYVSKIQPILINGCGNARCHGGDSQSEFRLENVRSGRGAHRLSTERNLEVVLQQLDRVATRSPLLLYAGKCHGGSLRPAFDGSSGAQQRAAVESWATRVTRELPDLFGPIAVATNVAPDAAPAQNFVETAAGSTAASPGQTPPLAPSESGDPLLERVLREQQPDAFDPEEFNRMVHGRESGG